MHVMMQLLCAHSITTPLQSIHTDGSCIWCRELLILLLLVLAESRHRKRKRSSKRHISKQQQYAYETEQKVLTSLQAKMYVAGVHEIPALQAAIENQQLRVKQHTPK